MRIKLDESVPVAARQALVQFGHDVDTVVDEGLQGASDRQVFAAAKREGRFLITLDRGFGDIRSYPPGTHPGIAVLRLDSLDAETTTDALRRLLGAGGFDDLTGCIVVVRGDLVRVRRP